MNPFAIGASPFGIDASPLEIDAYVECPGVRLDEINARAG